MYYQNYVFVCIIRTVYTVKYNDICGEVVNLCLKLHWIVALNFPMLCSNGRTF